MRRGEVAAGLNGLAEAFYEGSEPVFHMQYIFFLAEMAVAQSQLGDARKGLELIDRALERSERHEERWYRAELLRIKGEILLKQGSTDASTLAENHYMQALSLARSQEALSWELRTTTSLARLWQGQGRKDEAHSSLAAVYGRYSEGFATADLRAAKLLLDSLS